jgi:hypothetical protein
MNMQTMTRKELYDLVWSTPLTTLAMKYSMTDGGLKKLCKRHNIPLPKGGYWSKLKFNKPVMVIALPEDISVENEIKLGLRDETDHIVLGIESPIKLIENDIIANQKELLQVPEKLRNPHPLIHQYKNLFAEHAREGNGKSLRASGDSLNIWATSQNISRAIRIMDTFIKVIESRGHSVKNKYGETFIVIKDEEIEISLREIVKRIPHEKKDTYDWNTYDYIATGSLKFSSYCFAHKYEISDGKNPLEQQLARFIAKLELCGNEMYINTLENQKNRAKQEELKKNEDEKRKRKEQELTNFEKLISDSKRWHKTKVLREYIDNLEAYKNENGQLTEKVKSWISWARKKADWYDPFIDAPDEILDEK